MNKLITLPSKSLTLSKEVLKERQSLDTKVMGLKPKLIKGLSEMQEIRDIQLLANKHGNEMNGVKEFKFKTNVPYTEKIMLEQGKFVTLCHTCNFTCHKVCSYANDIDKKKCSAMNSLGYCNVCSKKCKWDLHHNAPYYYECKTRIEEKTNLDLQKMFVNSQSNKSKQEQILCGLEQQF